MSKYLNLYAENAPHLEQVDAGATQENEGHILDRHTQIGLTQVFWHKNGSFGAAVSKSRNPARNLGARVPGRVPGFAHTSMNRGYTWPKIWLWTNFGVADPMVASELVSEDSFMLCWDF